MFLARWFTECEADGYRDEGVGNLDLEDFALFGYVNLFDTESVEEATTQAKALVYASVQDLHDEDHMDNGPRYWVDKGKFLGYVKWVLIDSNSDVYAILFLVPAATLVQLTRADTHLI